MSDAGPFTRSRARIERMCQLGLDARALRRQIIEELRSVAGFEAHAWLLTDSVTAVGAAPVADVPWMRELPSQIRLKYATRVNRWTVLGDPPVALLHEATAGDLAQSVVWRDLLVGYGVSDVASVVFQDRFGCWAFRELWRAGTARRFTGADARFLADLANPLTLALRRCRADTFLPSAANAGARPPPWWRPPAAQPAVPTSLVSSCPTFLATLVVRDERKDARANVDTRSPRMLTVCNQTYQYRLSTM